MRAMQASSSSTGEISFVPMRRRNSTELRDRISSVVCHALVALLQTDRAQR